MAVLDASSGIWVGTASELLDSLALKAGERVTKTKGWPVKPNGLSNLLNRLGPALRANGIEVSREREPGGRRTRLIRLRRDANHRPASSPSSQSRENAAYSGTDGDDDNRPRDDLRKGPDFEWDDQRDNPDRCRDDLRDDARDDLRDDQSSENPPHPKGKRGDDGLKPPDEFDESNSDGPYRDGL
jgi:hypothetical protein